MKYFDKFYATFSLIICMRLHEIIFIWCFVQSIIVAGRKIRFLKYWRTCCWDIFKCIKNKFDVFLQLDKKLVFQTYLRYRGSDSNANCCYGSLKKKRFLGENSYQLFFGSSEHKFRIVLEEIEIELICKYRFKRFWAGFLGFPWIDFNFQQYRFSLFSFLVLSVKTCLQMCQSQGQEKIRGSLTKRGIANQTIIRMNEICRTKVSQPLKLIYLPFEHFHSRSREKKLINEIKNIQWNTRYKEIQYNT